MKRMIRLFLFGIASLALFTSYPNLAIADEASSIDIDAAIQKNNEKLKQKEADQDAAREEYRQCMAPKNSIQWHYYAEAIEQKFKTLQGLSAEEREGWLEDIAVLREAEKKNLDYPRAIDPSQPNRYASRLKGQESSDLDKVRGEAYYALRAKCLPIMRKAMGR